MAKTISWVAALGVVVVGFLAIFDNSQSNNATIKIGAIAPLSGEEILLGESVMGAVQIAIHEINSAGGISGRQIELIAEDGRCDSEAGAIAAQKLVNIDKVKIIIGGACSEETLAAAEIAESAGVILVSPSASSPKISGAGDFIFRTYPSELLSAEISARYGYLELRAKKSVILSESKEYASGLGEVFKKTFSESGGIIASYETYKAGDEASFEALALKIKSLKPDLIYLASEDIASGIAVLKELKKNKVSGSFILSSGFFSDDILKENVVLLEGAISVSPYVDWNDNPKAKNLSAAYNLKFEGKSPQDSAASAYDAVYLIWDALKATMIDGEVNSLKIRDWFYEIKNWPAAVGPLTLDHNGDAIIGERLSKISKKKIINLGYYAL